MIVAVGKIKPTTANVENILNAPEPTTKKGLRRLLIPHWSHISSCYNITIAK